MEWKWNFDWTIHLTFDDGIIRSRWPVYSRPSPHKEIGEGLSVGEGATVHRLVLDGWSISSSSVKTANNKIPVSSAFNDSERLYGTTVCRCLVRRPHYSARLMRFGSRGPSEFSTEIRVSCFEGKTSKKLQILIPSKKPHFRYGKN